MKKKKAKAGAEVTETEVSEEKTEAEVTEVSEEQSETEEKKEKKPCALCEWFKGSVSVPGLIARCLLLLLLALLLSYAFLFAWGFAGKMITTFFYATYCALGTAGLLILIAIVLIILLIVDYNKKK